jgi:glucokinase
MADCYAGVDLGGTNICCALGTPDGRILCQKKSPTRSYEGPEAVLNRIAEIISGAAAEAGHVPAAVGMGVPGLLDLERGVTKFLPNLPTNWRDIPVRDALSSRIGCPIYLLNDARLATLGELKFGSGRECRTMAFFALGTGIGGGIVIDGKLRLGPLGAAGELGHQTIVPNGPRCGCGSRGCLEALASGPAIVGEGVRLMKAGLAPILHGLVHGEASGVTPGEMAQAAESGDSYVREAIVQAATYIGIAVANVVTILHPDRVLVGGGVAEIGALLVDTVRDTMRAHVGMFPPDDIIVARSSLGETAGVLGGIALALGGPSVYM